MRWLALLGLFSIYGTSVCGQDADTLSFYRLTIEDLSSVKVSSATKIAQKQSDAPGAINFFSRDDVKNYGWVSLQQMLYALPSFSPSQDYDRRTVSARGVFEGWNNNHLLMLIDGIQFNDNLYGSAYTWEIMPMVFTQSVEVIRGPASSLYGANAMNGVVSINTISASQLDGNGRVQFRMGSNGTRILDLLGAAKTNHADIVLSFNTFQTKGNSYLSLDDSFREDEMGNPLLFKVNDARRSHYFFGKIEGKGALRGLSAQYHQQQWQYGTGHGWLFNIPDQPESMHEYRQIATLSYSDAWRKQSLSQEYSIRYQKHGIDWLMRFYPDGAFDGFYPNGVTEFLETDAQDILARAQWIYKMRKGAAILGGIERSLFLYNGDNAHSANIDLVSTFEPIPDGKFQNMPNWFEFVTNKPVHNTGVFLQYLMPKILNERLQATASIRYDRQNFRYVDIYDPERPSYAKKFELLSPRFSVVFNASQALTLKAQAGRAFRTPAPTEMFGANTFTLASNISELRPEIITTYEVGMNWRMNKAFEWILTSFYNPKFDDIIAYSVANANLSTNLYNLSTAGVEAEMRVKRGAVSGFANYAYHHRMGEEIVDNTIAESDRITWVPAHLANAGMQFQSNKDWTLSLLAHYQGRVNRRSSGITDDTQRFRPDFVKQWISFDANILVKPAKTVEIGLVVNNIFDAQRYLIKNNAYRFDYRMEGRQLLLNMMLTF